MLTENSDDDDGREGESSSGLSVLLDERSIGGSGGEDRSGVGVNDGSSDGEEDEFSGHREVESLGEIFGLGHVSDERRNES